MSAYLYLLYSRSGDLAGLTLRPGPSDEEAGSQAEHLLAAQADVATVEVWRDARLIASREG